jgi:hypothetical protein
MPLFYAFVNLICIDNLSDFGCPLLSSLDFFLYQKPLIDLDFNSFDYERT